MNNDDTASAALLAWEIERDGKVIQHLAENPELLALVRASDRMCDGKIAQKIAAADALIARWAIDEIL